MRKILYTIMACLALGLVTSCQEYPEPGLEYQVPQAMHIEDASYITSTSAFLVGNLEHYNYVGSYSFLVSETEDFSNPIDVEVRDWTRVDNYAVFGEGIYNLKPATTYYYKLVATDGYATVSSEVKSFTTLAGFQLGKITYTDWDGEVKELPASMMPLGVSVFTHKDASDYSYYNMSVSYSDGKWQLPYDFGDTANYGTVRYCTVYTPYTKSNFMSENKGVLHIDTYKNPPSYQTSMDYLTGSAEISGETHTVNINLTHALARVRFHFSIANGSSMDVFGVENLRIEQDANQKVVPTSFWYDMSGTGSVFSASEFSTIDYAGGFRITRGEATDITILSAPTRASGTVTLKLVCSEDGRVLSLPIELKADSWKSGGTYDYNVVYDMQNLYITNIEVTEWNNNQGGNINIYD